MALRRLALSVATGRVSAVFLENGEIVGVKTFRTTGHSAQSTAETVKSWISGFRPDHMVSEDPSAASRKNHQTKAIIEAIADVFSESRGLNALVPRIQSYANKYDEAKALVERYPRIAHLRPERPRIWQSEPRAMGYFEALSFVEQLNV